MMIKIILASVIFGLVANSVPIVFGMSKKNKTKSATDAAHAIADHYHQIDWSIGYFHRYDSDCFLSEKLKKVVLEIDQVLRIRLFEFHSLSLDQLTWVFKQLQGAKNFTTGAFRFNGIITAWQEPAPADDDHNDYSENFHPAIPAFISCEKLKLFAHGISQSESLATLILNRNAIGNMSLDKLEILSNGLVECKNLKFLYLGSNELSRMPLENIVRFFGGLRGCINLKELYVGLNSLAEEQFELQKKLIQDVLPGVKIIF